MKPFLDTEFSSLHKTTSRLISIGLVAEDGREFYAETPIETWRFQCSGFVREVVEPLLWQGDYAMTPAVLSDRLRNWLRQFGMIEVVTDAPDWDWWFLTLIFEIDRAAGMPSNIVFPPTRFDPEGGTLHDEQDMAAREAFDAFWEDKKNFRHHALADARALRVAWLAWERGL